MLNIGHRTFFVYFSLKTFDKNEIIYTFADVMVWIPFRVTPLNRESGVNPGQSPLL